MESQTSRIIRMVRPLNLIVEMYRHRQIIDTDHLQFEEMTKNCKYRPGGPVKAYDAAKQADLSFATQIAENTSTNPDDDFVIQIEASMHLEMNSHQISGEKRKKAHNY